MRRPGNRNSRAWATLRPSAAILAALVAGLLSVLGTASAATAHGSGTPTPADGETVLGTPAKILVELAGESPVTLELRRADGTLVPFTGTVERAPGIVRARPPVLDHGTYVIEWRSADGDGWSTFSVGEPDAVISGGTRAGRPFPTAAAGAAAILAGLLACAARPSAARRNVLRVAAGVLILAGSIVLVPPTSLIGIAAASLLLLGAAGGALLAAGVRDLTDATPDDAGTSEGIRSASVLVGVGLVLLTGAVAGPLLRAASANPFTGATFLAAAAGLVLVAVLAPVALTGILGARQGRRPGRLAVLAAAAVVVAGAVASALPVTARVEGVAGDTVPAATCLAGTNRLQIQRCLDASLVATARAAGVVEALDTLRRLLGTESRARYFCHEASHAIGRESLRVNGTLADAFRDGYDVCDFGYYHGIVEGAAGGFDDATFLAAVPSLCEDFASAEELFYMQCNHGIGHAAARRTNNDMLRALEFCDALELNPALTGERLRLAANGCGTGVTMEWFATATADPNAAVTPRVSRPRDVCLDVPERWAPECIEYVGNTLDASAPVESLTELGAWCETTGHVASCYRGLARAAAGVGIPARDAIGVCDDARDRDARDECVTFYIAAVATTIDFDVAAVDRICRELPVADRDGPLSLCGRVRGAVVEVLAAGDGKNRG